MSRVMEVGCAAGRTSFELSRGFESVLGVDISQAFIDKCNEIKRTGQTQYWLPGEGELGETKTAHLPPEIVSHTHTHTLTRSLTHTYTHTHTHSLTHSHRTPVGRKSRSEMGATSLPSLLVPWVASSPVTPSVVYPTQPCCCNRHETSLFLEAY